MALGWIGPCQKANRAIANRHSIPTRGNQLVQAVWDHFLLNCSRLPSLDDAFSLDGSCPTRCRDPAPVIRNPASPLEMSLLSGRVEKKEPLV